MKLIIERVENGFLVKQEDFTPVEMSHVVFEDSEEVDAEIDSGYSLLWHIIEYYGLRKSKHDPRRLSVTIDSKEEE